MTRYSKDFLLGLYRQMLAIRLCEESMVEPILNGEVKGPVHLYTGEEAIAVGVCAALSPSDYVFGNHRSHGHYLAKGGDIKALVAEIYGKSDGCARGRGGSMHVIDPNAGMLGAAPIVAGTISLAVGAALAARIKREDRLVVSFFGDGAAGEGVLYESINLAALKKLPVLFVCENNYYSTHLPIRECRPNDDIYKMGYCWDIASYKIDGNDVLKVYETATQAVDLCKSGKGPVFIECSTYRFRGHVGPDDNIQGAHTDIRPADEVSSWREKDPLIRFRKYLLTHDIANDAEMDVVTLDIEKTISEAHRTAETSPYPRPGELLNYVYKK